MLLRPLAFVEGGRVPDVEHQEPFLISFAYEPSLGLKLTRT
jgi:hypothetical protein